MYPPLFGNKVFLFIFYPSVFILGEMHLCQFTPRVAATTPRTPSQRAIDGKMEKLGIFEGDFLIIFYKYPPLFGNKVFLFIFYPSVFIKVEMHLCQFTPCLAATTPRTPSQRAIDGGYHTHNLTFLLSLKVEKSHMYKSRGIHTSSFQPEPVISRVGYLKPLCCWRLIWPIQNDAKNLKNNWNPGTWVLTWECSVRAIQWIQTW